jgi:hypothetical protein
LIEAAVARMRGHGVEAWGMAAAPGCAQAAMLA